MLVILGYTPGPICYTVR